MQLPRQESITVSRVLYKHSCNEHKNTQTAKSSLQWGLVRSSIRIEPTASLRAIICESQRVVHVGFELKTLNVVVNDITDSLNYYVSVQCLV